MSQAAGSKENTGSLCEVQKKIQYLVYSFPACTSISLSQRVLFYFIQFNVKFWLRYLQRLKVLLVL